MNAGIYLAPCWLCLALCSTAFADAVTDAKPFGANDIKQAEETLKRRNVSLNSTQRKLLVAELEALEAQREEKSTRQVLTANTIEDAVPYLPLIELLDSPVLQHAFQSHEDPMVRFRVDLKLAGAGDLKAAERLPTLFRDNSLPTFDARAIKTMLSALGVDPEAEPADMIQHLEELQTGIVRFKSGDVVPDFTITDTNNHATKLSELRQKIVFVHFWATNCVPCMAEMPELRAQISAFPDDQVETIFVSLDYEREAFERVSSELGIPCRHVFDGQSARGEIAKIFRINQMPVDVVIDREGKFVSYSSHAIQRLIDGGAPD